MIRPGRRHAVVPDVAPQVHPALPLWDKVLTDGHASLVRARHAFRYLPSAPRCKLCNNPFGGPVGRLFARRISSIP